MIKSLEPLVSLFAKLPGFGPKSSKRVILHLIKNKEKILQPILSNFDNILDELKTCQNCFNIDTIDPCAICADINRAQKSLCIVSDIVDIWAIEKVKIFRGHYHMLGGVLSAVEGIGPEELNIKKLIERLRRNPYEEIVMALSPTVDGQTTMHYLCSYLKDFNVKITTLAQGIPLGGELDYIDDGTISMAFQNRNSFL